MRSQNKSNLSRARASARGRQATLPKKHGKQQGQPPPAQSRFTGSVTQNLPGEVQQAILHVFTQAFPIMTQPDVWKQMMQEVKSHLYNRDFLTAFGKPEYLDAYASRWSAARALAYADIFTDPDRRTWFQPLVERQGPPFKREASLAVGDSGSAVPAERQSNPRLSSGGDDGNDACVSGEPIKSQSSLRQDSSFPVEESPSHPFGSRSVSQRSESSQRRFKAAVLGGGAGAEIVALAATWRRLHSYRESDDFPPHLDILAVDIADWSESVTRLASALSTPPSLPSYASQTARDANRALIDADDDDCTVTVVFDRRDVLQASLSSLQVSLADVSLVTVMFTLNELFTTSLPKTTSLLLNLTESIKPDAHLVVVDSPGSYSEIKLGTSSADAGQGAAGQAAKKYPMKWLLDHALLEVAGEGADARWVKIEDEASKWFRIDEQLGLRYGVELENCRYQIHVFRKVR